MTEYINGGNNMPYILVNFINPALNVVMTTQIRSFKTKRTLCLYNSLLYDMHANVTQCGVQYIMGLPVNVL